MTKRLFAAFLVIVMIFTFVPTSALAVTNSQIAEDGTYYTNYLYGYKNGKLKYSATLGVEVKNGVISSLEISNATDSKMFKALTPQLINSFTNITASVAAVEAVEETSNGTYDAVSSSTVSSSYSSSSKYSINLKDAIIDALSNASARSGSADETVYSGSTTVNGYTLNVDVTTEDGTITSVTVGDGSTGSWDSLIASLQSNYVGKSTDSIDAVTGATPYTTAVNTAVRNALGNDSSSSGSSNDNSGNSSGGSSNGTNDSEIISDGTYTATGNVNAYYVNQTIPATVTIVVSNGKFTSVTAETTDTTNKNVWQLQANIGTFSKGLVNSEATTTAIENVIYSTSVSPNYPDEDCFKNLKALLLSAVGNSSGNGSGDSSSNTDAGKTISPGSSATIYVGESLTLQGTKPSSYGNYHYWYTDEEDVDYIEWDINNSASNTYYAGTNVCNITGIAAGTVKVYHQYLSRGSWVNPGEIFTITVLEKSSASDNKDDEEEATAPDHKKSIAGADDNYTISLDVTGKDVTSTSTSTTPGDAVTKGTNLVMVIDVSGSIVGKETELNSAIQALVNGLPDNSQVGVVTFNESATSGTVFTKSTISGLSFSGVSNAGTNMSTGITNATALLNNTSKWTNTNNNKAMVIISDFDADDYTNSINSAKTAKNGSITIYSVEIDSSSVADANRTDLTTDYRQESIPSFTRYVSSQYPSASAVNNSMFGMFNQATVTPGTADDSKTYVYGAGEGKWSEIFAEIKETQNITTTTETTLRTKNVVIQDVLSDYVELSQQGTNYGITVDGLNSSQYTVNVSGKTVTVTFASDFELSDGTTYTVKIPVKPTAKAQTEANKAASETSTFPSNNGAKLTYAYGDNDAKTVVYSETPVIAVAKQYTHTLIYDANGGTGAPNNQETTNNSSSATFTISSTVPTRTGYTFKGWEDRDVNPTVQYQPGTNVTVYGEKTLYAVWNERVTLTYDANGGTGVPDPVTVDSGEEVTISHIEPTRTGYKFLGWADSDNATAADYESGDDLELTADKTIYAVWQNNTGTVIWKNWNGEILETDENVAYGTIPTYDGDEPEKERTAQYTYTFTGWNPEIAPLNSETVTYTAQFSETVNEYTITWVDGDGNTLKTDSVAYGETPSYTGETPTKTATDEYTYIFNNTWSPDIVAVKENATYTAQFGSEVNKYTITWKNDDDSIIDTTTVAYGETPTHTDPTKAEDNENKYTFAGWTPEIKAVDGNAEYKATYTAEKKTYTITWKNDDDSTIDTTTVAYGETPTHADPTKAEDDENKYTFAGWTPEIKAVDGNAEYKATYTAEKKTYTITWKNDDDSTIDTTTAAYGDTPTHSAPTKENTAQYTYKFTGWSPDIEIVTGNAEYTAQFEATVNTYTIKFVDEDGTTVLDEQILKYGAMPEYSKVNPTKTGDAEHNYVFAGWTPAIVNVTGDATYTATYTEGTNTYTVTWVDEDGTTVLDTQTLAYGSTPVFSKPTPTKADDEIYSYTFAGWDNEPTAVTGNVTYKATYKAEQTAFQIFIDDYTKSKAAVDGVVSGNYYRDEVKFTVSADNAVAFGIDNKDDTYTRMYCTQLDDGAYEFTVNVTDSDVYLVEGFKGDVDLNGKVQLRDSSKIADYMVHSYEINDTLNKFIGDVDANGKIQLRDSSKIADYMVHSYAIEWDLKK